MTDIVTTPRVRPPASVVGPWAWLRMLDKAQVEPTAHGERYKVTFDLDGRKASLEMSASSVVNPFKRSTLEQFRCPERL